MAIDNKEQFLTSEFEWFHQHPELSFEEVETTKRIREDLAKAEIPVLDLPLKTGVVAQIGTGKAPFVALRGDIDALPITEATDLPYSSLTPGKMHACGHDFHLTSVLGAAYALKEREAELVGTVYIVFQPGEEAPGGAKTVLETGSLRDVKAMFGLHSLPVFPVGTVGVRTGAVTASVDKFQVKFHGKETHAAHPDRGVDSVLMASSFVTAAQSIVARNVDPARASLVSITHIEGGSTWNITPGTTWIEGTTRSLTSDDRKLIKERFYRLAEGIAASFGGQAEIDWYAGPPATNNTPEWAELAKSVAQDAGLTVKPAPVSLAGEDFAYFQESIPGCFVLVGTGISPTNHNPKFRVDPSAILPTAAYLADLADAALKKLQ